MKKINDFLDQLKFFNYKIESIDRIWDIIFPDQKEKWHHLKVVQYKETFYLTIMDRDYCQLSVEPDKEVQVEEKYHRKGIEEWESLIISAMKWLKNVKSNWLKANQIMVASYPLNQRKGIVPHALIRDSVKDLYDISKELGEKKRDKFIHLVEKGYFMHDKNFIRESMTANDFFEYCKIAYIAGKRDDDYVDKNLTGREMYERYADGRDNGLLDIAGDCPQEFADWIDKKHPKSSIGGHPWEIKRGGNTTHIDLYVSRPSYRNEGFVLTLNGPSFTRLKETLNMFLAIHNAGLPITISDAEGIRKRLLGTDNIGIIPAYMSTHRANQGFYKQDVNDVMHYDDLGRFKRRITPFITWEPLPILIPK